MLERTISFASGKLLVRAYDSHGAELIGDNVFVHVYAAGERSRPVTVARSGELIVLMEGAYDVRGEDTRDGEGERWLEGIRLEPGRVTERSMTF